MFDAFHDALGDFLDLDVFFGSFSWIYQVKGGQGNGDYANVQKLGSQAWCVNPVSGEVTQESKTDSNGEVPCPSYCNLLKSKALVREIGRGYIPECESDPQGFSPVQCSEDQASCWCVFDNGQEAPGTRVNGQRSACERPRCPLPYNASSLTNGLQPFQSVQIQTQFQLILPPEKTCSPDYSGLLETFQIFILDELKSRGFCHIQETVSTLGNLVSVPVCGDSAVLVQCAAADRLGVNVTWQAMLKNVPVTALPDLYDIAGIYQLRKGGREGAEGERRVKRRKEGRKEEREGGREGGRKEGKRRGREEGRKEEREGGRKEGRKEEREGGREEGRKERGEGGRKEGRKEGKRRGKEEGRKEEREGGRKQEREGEKKEGGEGGRKEGRKEEKEGGRKGR
ncbi:thyroglobulin-like [Crotalus adamanteus]|uniref:Thyroglobulin-like n=1 Tax=Crotalus adamanteus TaxID=8729 RepID=A0AAW1BM21_CROAD